jgi:hypothetical protein
LAAASQAERWSLRVIGPGDHCSVLADLDLIRSLMRDLSPPGGGTFPFSDPSLTSEQAHHDVSCCRMRPRKLVDGWGHISMESLGCHSFPFLVLLCALLHAHIPVGECVHWLHVTCIDWVCMHAMRCYYIESIGHSAERTGPRSARP